MNTLTRLSPIDALFGARSVAVAGASTTRHDATGNHVLRKLRGQGFAGEVWVVSRSGASIEGAQAATSVEALPPVDVIVIATAAGSVAEVVEDSERAGCPIVIILTVGMDDHSLSRVRSVHARGRTAVHGPNCMGVIDVSGGAHFWALDGSLDGIHSGSIALVSQSGSAAIFVARSIDSRGFSRIISSGNEVGITTADYVHWLADDPATSTIGLIIESIPDGETFARAIAHAHANGKAVAALKVGRSDTGAAATAAHTGAMVSAADAYDALFTSIGLPSVSDYDELATTLQMLDTIGPSAVRAARAGVITISGGQAALAADLAAEVGIDVPPLSKDTTQRILALLPDVTVANPFDAGSGTGGETERYAELIEILGDDPSIDVVMVILDAQDTLNDDEIEYEAPYYPEIYAAQCDVPVIIVSSSAVSIHEDRRALAQPHVPLLRGIRNGLVAVRSAATRPNTPAVRPKHLPGEEEVSRMRADIAHHQGALPQQEAMKLLSAYGLHAVASMRTADMEDATAWADEHGYPIVMKVAAPGISHRSDVGGVVLDISSDTELRAAWDRIRHDVQKNAPGEVIEGMEIQRQLVGQLEAFAGFVDDERLGGLVACGMGGVLVELIGDVHRAAVPVSHDSARILVDSTRFRRILDGYRSLNMPTDATGFVDSVERLSWLAHDFRGLLSEGDLNPLLVEPGSGEVTLVDALLIRSSKAGNE